MENELLQQIKLELKVINLQLNSIRRRNILDKKLDYYYNKAQENILDED